MLNMASCGVWEKASGGFGDKECIDECDLPKHDHALCNTFSRYWPRRATVYRTGQAVEE
jgi:hypothetical protein